MSKTVKRVMTVMMVGLVTMLGTKAEAHYTIRWSRLFWCSTHVVGKLSEVNTIDVTAAAVFRVKTRDATYKCSDGTSGNLGDILQTGESVTLVARRLLLQDLATGITRTDPAGVPRPPGPPTLEFVGIVSDEPILDLVCPNDRSTSGEIIIQTIQSAVVEIYTRGQLASRARFNECKLRAIPPVCGTPYDCSPNDLTFEHLR